MATWDWDAYHAELLRRTRTVPPLMQSVWNESANEADWLAPAQFPLPIYRLLPDEGGVPRRSLLSEHPCDPRDGWDISQTHIFLRQGLISDVFRSCLIWSLVKQTPAERRRFFGTTGTGIEHPRVGYIYWRDVPPKGRDADADKPLLDLNTLMMRSLKRLKAGSVDHAARIAALTVEEEKAFPENREERAAAYPQYIIFDGTGCAGNWVSSFKYLVSAIGAYSNEYEVRSSEAVILSEAPYLSMGYIDNKPRAENPLFVDAPATRQELQTFFLGWERWRGESGRPRELLTRADRGFEDTLASIEALGMRNPALAVDPDGRNATSRSSNQATLDIACAIAAMRRDGRPVTTVAQICAGLRERMTRWQRHELECFLWAFLKARGFDNDARFAEEFPLGKGASIALDKPAALPFFFKTNIDVTPQHEGELTRKDLFLKRVAIQTFYVHAYVNPVLPSIFRTLFSAQNNDRVVQLMNEPLALGFLAQDACHHLIERTDGITEKMLSTYPGLMNPKAWVTFTEQLFSALDEANAPLLARQVLHVVYPYCVIFNQDVASTGLRKLRKIGLRRFDGPSSTVWDRFKSALKTVEKVMQEGYADTVVRASLRHNLATGGSVPPAWAHWIGKPLLDDDFDGELRLPNKKEITERVAYLHELLSEPIPACDNAALLLTYAGKLQVHTGLQL